MEFALVRFSEPAMHPRSLDLEPLGMSFGRCCASQRICVALAGVWSGNFGLATLHCIQLSRSRLYPLGLDLLQVDRACDGGLAAAGVVDCREALEILPQMPLGSFRRGKLVCIGISDLSHASIRSLASLDRLGLLDSIVIFLLKRLVSPPLESACDLLGHVAAGFLVRR